MEREIKRIMNINEVEHLLEKFDQSSLREFSYQTGDSSLSFSKNDGHLSAPAAPVAVSAPVAAAAVSSNVTETVEVAETPSNSATEGEVQTSPLVGVAYLKPAPDKSEFVKVGDSVKKGQTLLIIEAMKVMNEVPAERDGIVTEILVSGEEVVEFGQGLVRIK